MIGYLSLGSNLGDRNLYLHKAKKAIEDSGINIIAISRIYESSAYDVPDKQGDYLNIVLKISTEKTPRELLEECLKIEASLGRVRQFRNSARTIDIDILILEGENIDSEYLRVPHPKLEERPFVILPLFDVEPDLILASGKPLRDLKKIFMNDDIRLYAG